MVAKAPQIGFDRFIQLDWVATALRVRVGTASLEDLNAQLAVAGLGKEAQIKTRTKLNALALAPRDDLVDFIDRGVSLFAGAKTPGDVAPFAWGAALANYPYFGRVAEITGRLTAIQGDCSAAEIHRRISEFYGDREVTKRATQAVLQTLANWGAIERVDKGKRLVRLASRAITHEKTVAWLIEAALRHLGKAMALTTVQSMAVLYPFTLNQPIAYVISRSETLELRSEGPSQQFVVLSAAT